MCGSFSPGKGQVRECLPWETGMQTSQRGKGRFSFGFSKGLGSPGNAGFRVHLEAHQKLILNFSSDVPREQRFWQAAELECAKCEDGCAGAPGRPAHRACGRGRQGKRREARRAGALSTPGAVPGCSRGLPTRRCFFPSSAREWVLGGLQPRQISCYRSKGRHKG